MRKNLRGCGACATSAQETEDAAATPMSDMKSRRFIRSPRRRRGLTGGDRTSAYHGTKRACRHHCSRWHVCPCQEEQGDQDRIKYDPWNVGRISRKAYHGTSPIDELFRLW